MRPFASPFSALPLTLALACALSLGAPELASATSYTNSASGPWDADASWTGAKPAAGGAADAEIVFANSVVSSNSLSGTFRLNRMEFAGGTATLSGGALSFTNNGATGPQLANTGSGPVAVRNAIALGYDTTFYTVGAITNYGTVSGKGGLVKTGGGTLCFATNNLFALSYAGSTLVSAGTLIISTHANLTTCNSTNVTVQGGATLRLVASTTSAFALGANNTATINSSINVQSNGTLTCDVPTIHCGTLTAPSGATINSTSTTAGGCVSVHATDTVSSVVVPMGSLNMRRIIMEPYSAVNPSQTLRYDGTGAGLVVGTDVGAPLSFRPGTGSSGTFTFKFDIADSAADVDFLVPFLNVRPAANVFVKAGAGAMRVDGLDWAQAATASPLFAGTVSGGSLIWNVSATNPVGVNLSSLSIAPGATFQLGAGGVSGVLYTAVSDDGTLAFSRSNAVTFTNAISGAGGVVQKGPGALTLTGANTYGGGTAVSGGTLWVAAPGSLGGSGAVTVSGAAALGGTGTIAGPVAFASGATLIAGGSNTVGTLTLSSADAGALTLNGNALLFDLSTTSGVCDQLLIAGGLVLNGANTIALSFTNGVPPAGTYTLMTYASKSGSGTLALNAVYPNATLSVSDTSVTLTVTGAGISYLKWKGGASGAWDTATANWQRDGVAANYVEGDAVYFDDTAAAGSYAVSASAAVSPSSVTFANAASNYTLSASVAGAGTALVKLGAGTTTLAGANSYGGGTILSGGTLSVSSTGNLPSAGPLTFSGGMLQILGTSFNSLAAYAVNWDSFRGGLDVALNNTITITNAIGGTGSFAKSGAGAVLLQGTNTYSGGTTVNAGFIRAYNASAIGPGPVNMAGGNGELDLMGGLVFTNAIVVRGPGVVNSAGSLQSVSGTSNTWNGPVTLGDSNARLGAPGGTLTVGGIIGSGANVYDLIIRNPNDVGGTIVLASTNTFRGNLWIRCGTIRLGVNNALPATAVLHLGLEGGQSCTNATFDLGGYDQQLPGLVDRGTDNLHVITNSAATVSTLTVNNPSTPYSFGGALCGKLALVKAGAATLTLTNASVATGSVLVNAGTLAVVGAGTLGPNFTNVVVSAGALLLSNSVAVADSAAVRIANGGGAKVNLADGVAETVGWLYFGDKLRPGGTYSAAMDSEHFAGTGVLIVRHGNGGLRLVVR